MLTNLQVLLPVIIVELLLVVAALIDLVKSERPIAHKWSWALVIVLINLIGPVAYFVFGRRNR